MATQQIRIRTNLEQGANMTCPGATPQAEEKPIFPSRRNTGFTLVELMIVVAIIGIILAIAIMNFTQWNDKYTVESYTKDIYSILMKARNDAANTNTQNLVTLAANQVQVTQDDNGNGFVDPGEPTTTKLFSRFTINSNIPVVAPTPPQQITFDRRGITNNIGPISITGYSPNASPGVDCIVVSKTRINMGAMTGGICVQQ